MGERRPEKLTPGTTEKTNSEKGVGSWQGLLLSPGVPVCPIASSPLHPPHQEGRGTLRRWSLFLCLFWKPALVLAVKAARMQLRWPFRRPAMAQGLGGVDLSLNCRASGTRHRSVVGGVGAG